MLPDVDGRVRVDKGSGRQRVRVWTRGAKLSWRPTGILGHDLPTSPAASPSRFFQPPFSKALNQLKLRFTLSFPHAIQFLGSLCPYLPLSYPSNLTRHAPSPESLCKTTPLPQG